MAINNPHILIVAEHASLRFGGEAALPLHYFRFLRKRGIDVWLIVHERTRDELKSICGDDWDRIHFIPDTLWHKLIWQASKILPRRVSYFTFGFASRFFTQLLQRRIAKRLIRSQQIDVIHQPIPVSPKEPSMLFGMGVPVVIGPMNGGMDYPAAFQQMQGKTTTIAVKIGRFFSNTINRLMPGKRLAATLLVANQRTHDALPDGVQGKVVHLVENGVDLSVWDAKPDDREPTEPNSRTKFVFVGRLVDWKAVDLLLTAFKAVVGQVPAELEIIGDGTERSALEQQAKELGLIGIPETDAANLEPNNSQMPDAVHFAGWLSQAECAQRLRSADALVLPSLLECGGAVVLEAMAMGMPVIATNWGGPTDYLNESCGILVNPTTRESFIEDLAAAMVKLAQSPDLQRAMGEAGHQRILNEFNWEVKVDKILEVYKEALRREKAIAPAKYPVFATVHK